MGKLIYLDIDTMLPIPCERVLDRAKEQDLEHVVIMGKCKDGTYYFASSTSYMPDVLWLLELLKIGIFEPEDK